MGGDKLMSWSERIHDSVRSWDITLHYPVGDHSEEPVIQDDVCVSLIILVFPQDTSRKRIHNENLLGHHRLDLASLLRVLVHAQSTPSRPSRR
jgi:hypothetical protein